MLRVIWNKYRKQDSRKDWPTYLSFYHRSKLDEEVILDITGNVTIDSNVTFFCKLLNMDKPVRTDQLNLIFISSVQTPDAV